MLASSRLSHTCLRLPTCVPVLAGGVTVGDGCILAAGAVITKDVPPWSVAAGNPARVVKQIKPGDKSFREVP